jgi:hypothetical protein
MTEETIDQIPVSEDIEIEQDVQDVAIEQPRTVPLEALEAERRKRQEVEAQNRALQEFMLKSKPAEPVEQDDGDDDDYITKAEMKRRIDKATFSNKREVLEEAFCQSRPDAVEMINQNLEQVIKQYP